MSSTAAAGPLHTWVAGPRDGSTMVLVHPNPLDGSFWFFQSARFATWFRCVAPDLPGYGTSPRALPGLTMGALADACWEAVDEAGGRLPAVLVGCSVGSSVVQHMAHLRPEGVAGLVLTGAGYREDKAFARRRGAAFRALGLDYRAAYALELLGPEARSGPLAPWLLAMLEEREATADLDSIVALFAAMAEPDPPGLQADLRVPVLLISGEEDGAHAAAFDLRDRLPDVRMATMPGAGHLAFLEQPWAFDALVLDFVRGLDLVT